MEQRRLICYRIKFKDGVLKVCLEPGVGMGVMSGRCREVKSEVFRPERVEEGRTAVPRAGLRFLLQMS